MSLSNEVVLYRLRFAGVQPPEFAVFFVVLKEIDCVDAPAGKRNQWLWLVRLFSSQKIRRKCNELWKNLH
jgi:hypothetical protein